MICLPRPCLMLVTEPSPRLPEIVAKAVAGGVDIVQWRAKKTDLHCPSRKEILAMLRAAHPALLFENIGYIFRGLSGIHLPEGRQTIEANRRLISSGGFIGRSVHSLNAAIAAAEEGADYLIAGTIFASQSHPEIAPAGLDFLRNVCAAVTIPVLAIGGVTPENTGDCLRAGAAGVAVLSPIMQAADPKAAAQAYRAALDGAWEG